MQNEKKRNHRWYPKNIILVQTDKLKVNTEKCKSIGFRNASLVNRNAFGQKVKVNKTGTSKVGAISKAQKAQSS